MASDRTCGVRRVWRDVLAEGVSCGLRRIERIMRENALRARLIPPEQEGLAQAMRSVHLREHGGGSGEIAAKSFRSVAG